ncbi:HNH endonuclease [Variovorax sp. 22077]|uniref:HNH endonuclease n=1 Tax=Variovorax sp. 22077 TaxID=3453867 RepID=UPI003F87E934
MKAVFDTKSESRYDDSILEYYHFPSRYLGVVRDCVGDWIVFRQPRADGGSMAYFAVAMVSMIEHDGDHPNHYYAYLSNFLYFDRVVPWLRDGFYAESSLRGLKNKAELGVFLRGRSVRRISDEDFASILKYGFNDAEGIFGKNTGKGAAEDPLFTRRVVEVLARRKIRDRIFRRSVCAAYEGRCAVTGIQLRDWRGNFEVQAAHVWSVADGGPDVVSNGIALCATAHWLFDRYLISINADFSLKIRDDVIPSNVLDLLLPQKKLIYLPEDIQSRPNLKYLEKHRARFEAYAFAANAKLGHVKA